MTFKPKWNNSFLLNAKRETGGPTNDLLKQAKITKEDVGKKFYSDPEYKVGKIISGEDFTKVNPDDVGGWCDIGEFNVNS